MTDETKVYEVYLFSDMHAPMSAEVIKNATLLGLATGEEEDIKRFYAAKNGVSPNRIVPWQGGHPKNITSQLADRAEALSLVAAECEAYVIDAAMEASKESKRVESRLLGLL